jgi:trehalose-6-phosphate synthase
MAPKQRRLDLGFFTRISKEERNVNVNKEFATLSAKLNKKSAMSKKEEEVKIPLGRPRKERESTLFQPKVVPMKKKKVRGRYTNWFSPKLWPLIHAAMKQHQNYADALGFLRSAYRFPGDLSFVYDALTRGSLHT